jgi:hypothetical protein
MSLWIYSEWTTMTTMMQSNSRSVVPPYSWKSRNKAMTSFGNSDGSRDAIPISATIGTGESFNGRWWSVLQIWNN